MQELAHGGLAMHSSEGDAMLARESIASPLQCWPIVRVRRIASGLAAAETHYITRELCTSWQLQ